MYHLSAETIYEDQSVLVLTSDVTGASEVWFSKIYFASPEIVFGDLHEAFQRTKQSFCALFPIQTCLTIPAAAADSFGKFVQALHACLQERSKKRLSAEAKKLLTRLLTDPNVSEELAVRLIQALQAFQIELRFTGKAEWYDVSKFELQKGTIDADVLLSTALISRRFKLFEHLYTTLPFSAVPDFAANVLVLQEMLKDLRIADFLIQHKFAETGLLHKIDATALGHCADFFFDTTSAKAPTTVTQKRITRLAWRLQHLTEQQCAHFTSKLYDRIQSQPSQKQICWRISMLLQNEAYMSLLYGTSPEVLELPEKVTEADLHGCIEKLHALQASPVIPRTAVRMLRENNLRDGFGLSLARTPSFCAACASQILLSFQDLLKLSEKKNKLQTRL